MGGGVKQMTELSFNSFIFSKCLSGISVDFAEHFETLKPDVIDYKGNSFQSRYRGFATYRVEGGDLVPVPEDKHYFNHKRDYHTRFEGSPVSVIENEVQTHSATRELLVSLLRTLPIPGLEKFAIGFNMIRVRASDSHMGTPAPGLHQDGYDFSCHLNVARKNVSGGASIISQTKKEEDVILDRELQPGEYVFFNDRSLYHTASPVAPRLGGYETYRDMVIIDFVMKH